MLARLFSIVYCKVRGHQFDARSVPGSVLVAFSLGKVVDAMRGALHRPFYGSVKGIHFRGRGAIVRNPQYLHLGSHVALGDGVKISAFSTNGIRLGSRVTIGEGANLMATAVIREEGIGLQVGDDTAIGRSNIIWGQGGVTIGSNCLLGPDVCIFSENHVFSDLQVPIRLQGTQRESVTIGDDCWIGAGARIMAGVVVGPGAVIAAGAVVTKSVDADTVVGGVPARKIGMRNGRTGSVIL